jgi:hypothetical protein
MFERLQHAKIPIWENKQRLKYLTLFRDLILDVLQFSGGASPRVATSPTTGQPLNQEQRRTEINERKPLAVQMIRLAGIKTERDCVTRLKGITSSAKFDVIEQLWDLESFGGSFRERTDVIEEAIGVYKHDQKKALFRTLNPFFWIVRLIEWIAQFPVWLFSSIFHVDQEKAARSIAGKIVTVISAASLWIFALIQSLEALRGFLDHLAWGKAILHRLGFGG